MKTTKQLSWREITILNWGASKAAAHKGVPITSARGKLAHQRQQLAKAGWTFPHTWKDGTGTDSTGHLVRVILAVVPPPGYVDPAKISPPVPGEPPVKSNWDSTKRAASTANVIGGTWD